MIEETIHGKCVAKKEGIYTIYVFQADDNKYVMCTKLPNWGPYNISVGDTGFLTTQFIEAGETYLCRSTNTETTYKYTNVYFKEFVPDNINTEKIIL